MNPNLQIVYNPVTSRIIIILSNIALSREKLLEPAWGFDYLGDTRTGDVHMQRLRKKPGAVRVSVCDPAACELSAFQAFGCCPQNCTGEYGERVKMGKGKGTGSRPAAAQESRPDEEGRHEALSENREKLMR